MGGTVARGPAKIESFVARFISLRYDLAMRRRILVIGGSGQVGRRIVGLLPDDEVVSPTHRELDLADASGLRRFLRENRFEAIVIPGAARDIDWCESHPREAFSINAEGPGIVAEESRGAQVLFFSTDAVFDGAAGPYQPEDLPNPISVYGQTKVEGEKRIQVSRRWSVLRTCQVYSSDSGHNFLTQIAAKILAGEPVLGWTDAFGTQTDADSLAEETVRVLGEGRSGILHLAGRDLCTRYEFALEAARVLGRPEGVVPGLTDRPNRPKKSGLISTLLGYREGIARQLKRYLAR